MREHPFMEWDKSNIHRPAFAALVEQIRLCSQLMANAKKNGDKAQYKMLMEYKRLMSGEMRIRTGAPKGERS